MQRTPTKEPKYLSDPSLASTKDGEWVAARQGKKRWEDNESDSDSARISHESRRFKSCCSTSVLNETLTAFREEMKAMHTLLTTMKQQQEEKYASIEIDITEIKKEVVDIRKKNHDTEIAIKDLEDKQKELDQAHLKLFDSNRKSENRVKDLIQRGIYLEKYNRSLEDRLGWLEQKELKLNVELINVRKQEGENIKEVVEKIAKELNLRVDGIEKVWRVRGEGVSTPIILKMCNKEARTQWFKSRKQQLTNHSIYNNNDGTRIYINENLTRQMRQLFWTVKQKLRDDFKFIWIQDGKILIKKSEVEKKVYNICCESDINKYISVTSENGE